MSLEDDFYAKPILKWAGGKTSLLKTFDDGGFIPDDFNSYYEPFFGAGAMFFYLWNNNRLKYSVISDLNSELFNLYDLVKNDAQTLVDALSKIHIKNASKTYYNNRAKFNSLKTIPLEDCSLEQRQKRALLLLYLNKTGYSGLYRENKKGEFNVPFGKYKNPTIVHEQAIFAAQKAFKNTRITCLDFKDAVKHARKKSFIYFDPPYMPCDNVSTFRDYHRQRFGLEEQVTLCELFEQLTKKGCYVMISNSSSKEINKMYKGLTVDAHITTITAPRMINQKNSGRQYVEEYIITNYIPKSKCE